MSPAKGRPKSPLSVGIVTADRALSHRIRETLEAEFAIGFTVSPAELEKQRASLEADLLVVAGTLTSGDSSPFARAQEIFPDRPIVACAPTDEGRPVRLAVQSGVRGVVWESRLEETLAVTIRAVRAGQVVVPQEAGSRIRPPDLTNREKQSLSLVLMGLTNREIADKLFVSESTVKSHLHSAYEKLGVHSRAEAVRRIADPAEGFGTGILAITGPGLARGTDRKASSGQGSSARKVGE